MNKIKKRAKLQKEQLGMAMSTARSRLLKSVLYNLLNDSNKNHCFRCKNTIDNEDELSIEHKEPWLHSEDPVEIFFDLGNVTFSHLDCNTKENRGRRGYKWSDAERTQHIQLQGKAVRCIELDMTFPSLGEAGRKLNIKSSNIGLVCRNVRKTAGGYHWEYLSKN